MKKILDVLNVREQVKLSLSVVRILLDTGGAEGCDECSVSEIWHSGEIEVIRATTLDEYLQNIMWRKERPWNVVSLHIHE